MINPLHLEMLRQFASELSHSARNLVAMASLMQVARELGTASLVEAHWACVQENAGRVHDVLRQWSILGISLESLRIWEDAPNRAALVKAAARWGALPARGDVTAADHEAAVCGLRMAALRV